MDEKFQVWCQTVTDRVRFKPDRYDIAEELKAHYQDHVKDLMRLGYDVELAEERALGAMGDPVEIGLAMDRAHKPWLGWLWQATRAMILVLLIAIAVALIKSDGTVNDAWLRWQNQLTWTEPASGADWMETEHAILWLAPGEVTEEEGIIHAKFHLWVEMKTPFGYSPNYAMGYLEISDDRGSIPRYEQTDDYTWPEAGYWRGLQSTDMSWTRYQWSFELVQEHTPRWVELRYPYGGNDWTLRAEWEVAE